MISLTVPRWIEWKSSMVRSIYIYTYLHLVQFLWGFFCPLVKPPCSFQEKLSPIGLPDTTVGLVPRSETNLDVKFIGSNHRNKMKIQRKRLNVGHLKITWHPQYLGDSRGIPSTVGQGLGGPSHSPRLLVFGHGFHKANCAQESSVKCHHNPPYTYTTSRSVYLAMTYQCCLFEKKAGQMCDRMSLLVKSLPPPLKKQPLF